MSVGSASSISSPERTALVLAVSPLTADRLRLREILSQGNWKLHEASGCHEALELLRGLSVPVLLCERDHADVGDGDVGHGFGFDSGETRIDKVAAGENDLLL